MLNPFYLSFFIKWVSNEQSGKFFHTTSTGWNKIGTYLSLQHVAKLRHGVLFASTSVHVGEISKPRASLLLQTDQVRVILAMALRSASNFPKDNLFSSRANELVLQPFFLVVYWCWSSGKVLTLLMATKQHLIIPFCSAKNVGRALREKKKLFLTVVTTPLMWEELGGKTQTLNHFYCCSLLQYQSRYSRDVTNWCYAAVT